MQLLNVSAVTEAQKGAAAAPKETTFKDAAGVQWNVKGEKVVSGYFTFASTLASVQKEFDSQSAPKAGAEEAPLWKKPFIHLNSLVSNVLGMITSAFKMVFFCFFPTKSEADSDQGEDSKTAKVSE